GTPLKKRAVTRTLRLTRNIEPASSLAVGQFTHWIWPGPFPQPSHLRVQPSACREEGVVIGSGHHENIRCYSIRHSRFRHDGESHCGWYTPARRVLPV